MVGVVTAKAAAIAVSMAIGYQVPLWFCVACPAVMGLLAPLVINAGAGAVANAACEHYQLPDADCAELWCEYTPEVKLSQGPNSVISIIEDHCCTLCWGENPDGHQL